jgi:hypothetical protein
MGLMNDIFSYQKEVEFEGELNNFVVVVRRFLECEQARALEITAELLVSRVRGLGTDQDERRCGGRGRHGDVLRPEG